MVSKADISWIEHSQPVAAWRHIHIFGQLLQNWKVTSMEVVCQSDMKLLFMRLNMNIWKAEKKMHTTGLEFHVTDVILLVFSTLNMYIVVNQTCFSRRFRGKVGSETLQQLCNLLLHEEADEGGGRVELQWDRHGYTSLPLGHGGLESIRQGLYLSIITLTEERYGFMKYQIYCKYTTFFLADITATAHSPDGQQVELWQMTWMQMWLASSMLDL